MTTILSQLPIERLGWVLIHSLWQFLAIALVVRVVERAGAGRGGASPRYYVGLCGLTAMTLAPVVTWFCIQPTPTTSAGSAATVSLVQPSVALPEAPQTEPVRAPAVEVKTRPDTAGTMAVPLPGVWRTLAIWVRPWLPILVACWLIGMSCCSLRPLAGLLTLRRLRTVGVSTVGQVLEESSRRIAIRLGIVRTVSILRSTLAKTPLVVGYLRPVLLVPAAMVSQLPVAELEAILAHELAHIRRHDFLVNLWQTSLETIFFYHPAVWSLSHRLRDEREHCCDDMALSIVGDPVCYGRALLHVEELRGPEALLALSAGGGSLLGRIQRLLAPSSPAPSVAPLLAGVLLPGIVLVSALAALALGAPGASGEKKPSVSDLVKQLSDPVQAKRDAAAAELRKSFVPPPRTKWEEKVARVKSGMTRDEALAAIGIMKREPAGVLPNEIAVDYRLDELWVARLWLDRHATPAAVTRAELLESLDRLWVNPPANFTGRWTTYYVSGQKSHAIDYKKGKYHGEFTSFHANGQSSVSQHYSEEHGAHGDDVGYYPSGKLTYRGRYFRGKRIGTWIHYDENGKVRSREDLGVPPEAGDDVDEIVEARPTPKPAAAPAARSLDIIIAQHVILWDGRVRTWDEVVKELREIRKAEGKPIHPNFYFTNGAHSAGHWDTYKANAFEVYKELFEPAGMSLGGISPRAGPRYDILKEPEDLVPDAKTLRSGVVVMKGKPVAGVLVVLAPEEGLMPIVLKPDLSLRDRHDEVWTITDAAGRFTLPVEPVHAIDKLTEPPTYALAAISPIGYSLAAVPPVGVGVRLELEPLARVDLTPVEGKPQAISLAYFGGLPDKSPGFTTYEIDLADKPISLALPPGKVVVRRTFKHEDGGAKSYPAETVRPAAGENKKVKLPNITEEEAERKWIEDSIRPKRDPNQPEK